MNQPNPFKWRHFEAEIILLVRALVPALLTQLPRPGGNDAGTGTAGRSHHDLPLGAALCPRTGQTLPASPQSLQRLLESG